MDDQDDCAASSVVVFFSSDLTWQDMKDDLPTFEGFPPM